MRERLEKLGQLIPRDADSRIADAPFDRRDAVRGYRATSNLTVPLLVNLQALLNRLKDSAAT